MKALLHAACGLPLNRYQQSYPQELWTYDKVVTYQALSFTFA